MVDRTTIDYLTNPGTDAVDLNTALRSAISLTPGVGDMLKLDNLAGLASAPVALTNIGALGKANNLGDVASVIASHDNIVTSGTDVASAAIVDLDVATGEILDITGTVTTTAITLTAGRKRLVRCVAAWPITASVSLIVDGAISGTIIFAANDYLLIVGGATQTTVTSIGIAQILNGKHNIWQTPPATSTDIANFYINRNADFVGGTVGWVNAAIRADTTVGANVTSIEWAVLGVCNNSSTTGTGGSTGVYGQGNRMTPTTGPTWGGVMEARDKSSAADPTVGLIGLEVDAFANGTDINNRRICIDAFGGKGVASGATATIYAGLRIGPQDGDITKAIFTTGVVLQGTITTGVAIESNGTRAISTTGTNNIGIDLSLGTHPDAAIRIKAGENVSFDGTSVNTLSYSAANTGLVYKVSGVIKHLFLESGDYNLTGQFEISSAGNITTAATGGAASGLPTLPDGYLSFKLDGVQKKIPYFAA